MLLATDGTGGRKVAHIVTNAAATVALCGRKLAHKPRKVGTIAASETVAGRNVLEAWHDGHATTGAADAARGIFDGCLACEAKWRRVKVADIQRATVARTKLDSGRMRTDGTYAPRATKVDAAPVVAVKPRRKRATPRG